MRILIFLAFVLAGLLVSIWPAKGQDCFNVAMTIVKLDEMTKGQNLRGRAYLYQTDHPNVELLIVWLSAAPDAVLVSSFRNGCLVQRADGSTAQILKIDNDIRHAVGLAELLFDNGGETPFATH